MDTTAAPQIIEHLSKSISFTPFDTKWIPGTAKFVLMGQSTRATGILQVHQLDKKELKLVSDMDKGKGYKCGTFGATIGSSEIALGEFNGDLTIWDLEKNGTVYNIKAHDSIVNCIDGIGGQNIGVGAPEIVTGGRDGCVRIWDKRQKGPVVSLEPVEKEPAIPDCWCVAFGNAYNNEERVVVAGYDNGDIKLFDLRMNQLRWDTNVKNGVCGIEFDRKDILMNKLVATTLESKVNVFDMRTHHVELGYASLVETAQKSTIWGVKHLPQNRDIFATLGGNGALNLYKYNYPSQRAIQDVEGKMKGVVGTLELINSKDVAQQPVASLDWHTDKLGLAVMSGLDQTVKVLIVTKLNLY